MHPPGRGIDLQRQLVGVGGFELGERAVIEDELRQRVLGGEFLEGRFGGRGLAGGGLGQHRQLQLIEQNGLDLLGRTDIEHFARLVVGAGFDFTHALVEFSALLAQQVTIDQYAAPFHGGQHRQERHFDLFEHAAQRRGGFDARIKMLVQTQADLGILGRVRAGLLDTHFLEANLLGALARHVFIVDGVMTEILERDGVEIVATRGAVQHIGFKHGVKRDAAQADPVIEQHVAIVFQVMTDFARGVGFQQRSQFGQHGLDLELRRRARIAVRERHIGRATWGMGE